MVNAMRLATDVKRLPCFSPTMGFLPRCIRHAPRPIGDGQPQAGGTILLVARAVSAVEEIEQMWEIFLVLS